MVALITHNFSGLGRHTTRGACRPATARKGKETKSTEFGICLGDCNIMENVKAPSAKSQNNRPFSFSTSKQTVFVISYLVH